MVPKLIIIVGALSVLSALVALRRYYAEESAKLRRESRRWWWFRHKQHRDDLLEGARAMAARGVFRKQRQHESPWSYAKTFDRWSAKELKMRPIAQWSKPYMTSERTDNTVAWSSIQLYWWAAERDGLVHRAAVLRHDEGESFVLRCDHDELLEPSLVEQYLDGQGPVLTCVRCFGMPRT